MRAGDDFFNLYNHDFVRVAVGIPSVRVADPAFNAEQTIELMAKQAARTDAGAGLFPELGLSAYSCDDLFHQGRFSMAVGGFGAGGGGIATPAAGQRCGPAAAGRPYALQLRRGGRGGQILGVVPKSYLPNYREFYERAISFRPMPDAWRNRNSRPTRCSVRESA